MNANLDREARALVRQARAADRPPPTQVRRRVWQAVCAAVPGATVLGAGTTAAQAASAAGIGAKAAAGASVGAKAAAGLGTKLVVWVLGGFVVGLGATGTAHWVWSPSESPAQVEQRTAAANRARTEAGHAQLPQASLPRAAAAAVPPASAAVETGQGRTVAPARGRAVTARAGGLQREAPAAADEAGRDEAVSAVTSPPGAAPAGAVTPAAPNSRGDLSRASLAQVVRLLERVHHKLRDSEAEAALQVLRQQEVRFSHSQLRPDFEVARVLAWCELGHTQEARRAAERFLRANPGSPLGGRLLHSCAFKAPSPKAADRSQGKQVP